MSEPLFKCKRCGAVVYFTQPEATADAPSPGAQCDNCGGSGKTLHDNEASGPSYLLKDCMECGGTGKQAPSPGAQEALPCRYPDCECDEDMCETGRRKLNFEAAISFAAENNRLQAALEAERRAREEAERGREVRHKAWQAAEKAADDLLKQRDELLHLSDQGGVDKGLTPTLADYKRVCALAHTHNREAEKAKRERDETHRRLSGYIEQAENAERERDEALARAERAEGELKSRIEYEDEIVKERLDEINAEAEAFDRRATNTLKRLMEQTNGFDWSDMPDGWSPDDAFQAISEALARAERAEAERDEARREREAIRRDRLIECEGLRADAREEIAHLNAALAGAREKCIKVIRALPEMSVGQHPEDMRTHCIGAIWKALSTPSSEKAEGTEEDGR